MSSKQRLEAPLLEANARTKCERCGADLVMGTNSNGVAVESCAKGCFTRIVAVRRPGCPACGIVPWDVDRGCQNCGHGWTVMVCDWDGRPALLRRAGAERGRKLEPEEVSSEAA